MLPDRVNILVCQEFAKDKKLEGLDVTFKLCGPLGKLECSWLDPYLGLFEIEGKEGMFFVRDFRFLKGIWCEDVKVLEPY